MAASLSLSGGHNVRDTVVISGADFTAETPVTVEVSGPDEVGFSAVVVSDIAGAFDSAVSFVLTKEGTCTVSADDGTESAETSFRVSNAG